MFLNTVQFEDDKTIQFWLGEFLKDENMDKITLPNCIYSWFEISNEATRRGFLKDVW